MSYILDALRRADAERERERGASPGLHSSSRLLPELGEADDAPVVPPLPFARLLIGVLVLALAGAAGWWFLLRSPAEPMPVAAAPTLQAIQAPPPPAVDASAGSRAEAVPAPAPGGAGPVQAGSPMAPAPPVLAPLPNVLPDPPGRRPPAPDPGAAPIQPQLPGQSPPAPARAPRPTGAAPAAPPQTPPAARAESVAKARPTAPSASGATGAAGEPALMRLRDLPESLRRELPSLSLSGSMYSPQPGSRMVVLDGQVFREGQTVAPGLTLEQIGPRAAILAYKGQRFELPF